MDQTTNLLNQLHDIHLPPPVANWPWAPGWYGLIAVLIIGLIIGGVFFWRYQRRQRKLKLLQQQLNALQLAHDFAGLSALLRRVALKHYPRIDVAGLYGDDWLKFLDNTHIKNATVKFQSPLGKLLLKVPYQKTPTLEEAQQAEQLFELVSIWLRKHY